MTHLWEVEHPYYACEGNFYKPGHHNQFDTWAEFEESTLFRGDRDLNFLYRWDWDRDVDCLGVLKLFFVLQRKAVCCSAEVSATYEDEPAVRRWLEECARTVRDVWAPIGLGG